MERDNPTDLYLLGSGIKGALQLTVETIQALTVSNEAHVLHDDPHVIEEIKRHCAKVFDLACFYSFDQSRPDIYRAISKHLIERAREKPPISFVVHGHPLFLVSASEYTVQLGREQGVAVTVMSAVSSFDTLLTDIGVDFGYGLQLFDCSTLLANNWSMNNHVPALIFQLATLLNDRVVTEEPGVRILHPLVNYLKGYFPECHRCLVVHSSVSVLHRTEIVETTIGELHRDERIDLWKRPTLYIPAL
jgi:uncharacterized protein YabN with tetrapyrrole methylase and pyrophosphatase domain